MSTSIGPRGSSINIGKRGVHGNVGIPGTGLSYRARLDKERGVLQPVARSGTSGVPIWIALVVLVLLFGVCSAIV